jgi:hypothetical protein
MRVGAKDFFSVTSSRPDDNVLFKSIAMGAKNTTEQDPEGAFDLNDTSELRSFYEKKREYTCPSSVAELNAYARGKTGVGMPFGLPRLADDEHVTLMEWITYRKAQGPSAAAVEFLMKPTDPETILAWEKFLNSDSDGEKMAYVAKYLYEHWFNAHIHFDEMPGEFFRIVRSEAPPAIGIFRPSDREIETQLPTDHPGPKIFYYRFKKVDETITQKNHIPFRLSRATIESYQKLFFDSELPWNAGSQPSYETGDVFSNFKVIPETIRYRFMLENARYIVDSMVRAPVCVGASATFAIPDHFWAFFLKPESDPSSGGPVKLSPEGFKGLDLTVRNYTAAGQVEERFTNNYIYLAEYEKALRAGLAARGKRGLTIDDVWFGAPLRKGGVSQNKNAWLSITRHDNSSTVQYAPEGGMPQSYWLMSYANFERLYYNLVVNFKYWGSIKHKIGTWRSMSHERLDAEDMFLSMLPVQSRSDLRMMWSGGLELESELNYLGPLIRRLIKLRTGADSGSGAVSRYIDIYPLQSLAFGSPRQTAVTFSDGSLRDDLEMARNLRGKMMETGVTSERDRLNANAQGEPIYQTASVPNIQRFPEQMSFDAFESGLAQINIGQARGRFAAYIPAITVVRVKDAGGAFKVYSFVGNRGYKSHNISFLASNEPTGLVRDISRDTLSIYRGVIGDFPQLFLDIDLRQAGRFLNMVKDLNSVNNEAVFKEIVSAYAVRRNSAQFWPFVDWLHNYMANHPSNYGEGYIYAGILDLSNYL